VDDGSPNNGTAGPRVINQQCQDMPTEIKGVVGVSALGSTAVKSYYSNYGVHVTDIAAPGGDSRVGSDAPSGNGRIYSTVAGGGWGWAQGTSMASPHVAGLVALIRSTHPEYTADQAARAMEEQAIDLSCPQLYDTNGDGTADARCQGGPSGVGFYGAGMIDALAAVTQ